MTTKLSTPPKEVSSYFSKIYPLSKGYRHYYYWYFAEVTKKTKIYGCKVTDGRREITSIEAILKWYKR